jgi:segregation and condensation protein A
LQSKELSLSGAASPAQPGAVVSGEETDAQNPRRVDPRLAQHRKTQQALLPESWRVRLPVFEGPLDLLLHLIRINEVDITNIPVALICDQYHEYLDLMEHLDLDVAGEYIYEAAVLIQLKSRLLLPQPKADEGEALEDPRRNLVQRLLEYQRLKEAAETLAEVSSVRSGILTREWQKPIGPADAEEELDLGDLSLFDLLRVFQRVLDRFDRDHPEPMVVRGETFSVRQQIQRLLSRLLPGKTIELADDLLALSCRGEAIAAFLAVLEMCRMQLIRLHRTDDGEILLFRTTREVSAVELETVVG